MPPTDPPLVPLEDARRLFMHAQGLLDDPSRRAGPAALRALITRLGYVQVDSINVVERAHNLTLASRLDGYRQRHLDQLLRDRRQIFEHWTHDASAIPIELFPHWKLRFERYRRTLRENSWWNAKIGPKPNGIISRVRRRVADEGPLRSADFKAGGAESGGWWNWKPQKAALEYLWWSGELSVTRREGFQKVYDLTERVFPEHAAVRRPTERVNRDWACASALERLAVATPAEIAGYWGAVRTDAARSWCATAAKRGEAVEVRVESASGAAPWRGWAPPDWRQRAAALPEPPRRARLLSPFDPIIHNRKRAERLFGFDYRFEAFVPEPKRRYGYYVLPILDGDRLAGRLDPKLHRDRGELEIKGLWWEPGVAASAARRKRLEAAVERLATLVGARSVSMPSRRAARVK